MFSIYYLGKFHYFKVTELQSDLNNLGGWKKWGAELLIGQHVYVSITVKV